MGIDLTANEPSIQKVQQGVVHLHLPTTVLDKQHTVLKSLFRQYDIRGIVTVDLSYEPDTLHHLEWAKKVTLNPALAYALGCAYGAELLERLSIRVVSIPILY